MDAYELVRGPLAGLSFFLCAAGICYKYGIMILSYRHSPLLYPEKSIPNGLKSMVFGSFPLVTRTMRQKPLFSQITFCFHLCILILPLFLVAHIVLWSESFGIVWWGLPPILADTMTVCVLVAAVFFLARRLLVRQVRDVSQLSDYLIVLLVFFVFLSGVLASHHIGPYRQMLVLHILCGEILLISIPFSKLSHMLFFGFSRSYLGGEYGRVLGSGDW
ncbi:nitrate reductase [Desulfobacterales bacterium HSG17]|nr:nitrate reductase [Desulfobacterales bacterium HSG17]